MNTVSRALVTGASDGIGMEIARCLAQRGYNLVITARRRATLENLASLWREQYSVEVLVHACDLSREEGRVGLLQATIEKGLQVDVLINNAGFGTTGSFAELELARELEEIDLNVKAAVALTHAFLSPMLERRNGYILNVASTAAFQPGPFMAVYYATKAFLDSFTQAVAYEVRDNGVKVISFCPGPVETGFGEVSGNNKNYLFKKPGADARVVAEAAITALESGRPLKVAGFQNRVGVLAVRFLPGWLVKRLAAHLNSPVKPG